MLSKFKFDLMPGTFVGHAKGKVCVETDTEVWVDFKVFTSIGWLAAPILVGLKRKESQQEFGLIGL